MNERKSSDIIEDLITSLEELIDNLDDEFHHNNIGEWRWADNIRKNVLPISKLKFKEYLDEYIDRRILTFNRKHNTVE